MTSQYKSSSLEDDFFPDWGTEVPRSVSLSERINLPSSVVEASTLDDLYSPHPNSASSRYVSSFIANPSFLSNRSPCLLFFYGTLSLPHILQRVLELDQTPVLLPASVTGYQLRMWGPYPALVKLGYSHSAQTSPTHGSVISEVAAKVKKKLKRGSTGSTHSTSSEIKDDEAVAVKTEPISGMAYWGAEEDIPKLLRYEGENYEMVECVIRAGQDETVGRTFVWCGYSEELTEGTFDPTMFPDESRVFYSE